jgi:hypothetical protein
MEFTLTYKMRELTLTYGSTTDSNGGKYQLTLVNNQ